MTFLSDVSRTEARCIKCLMHVWPQPDAEEYLCAMCGGRDVRVDTRKPSLWRRIVRAIADAAEKPA